MGVWLLSSGLAAACLSFNLHAGTPTFGNPSVVGVIQSASLNEVSGLVPSRQNPNVLWTHNDSGDDPRLFAINPSGVLLGTFTLSGASAVDWEDVATGIDPVTGTHFLLAGDIGDNFAVRSSIRIYRVPEPAVSASQNTITTNLTGVETFQLGYPDGARDAETLLVDPLTGDWFVISKREIQSRIYRIAHPQSPSEPITMEYVGQLSIGLTTGGDVSPSGLQVLIRTYPFVYYYRRDPSQTIGQALTGAPANVPAPFEPQGEAVGWHGQESGYYTLSEGVSQPIYFCASADSDGDGLPDSREVAHGTDIGSVDSDGDGQSDGDEIVAGESPTNAASVLRITACAVSNDRVALSWYGRAGRVYSVQHSAGPLNDFAGFTTVLSNIVAQEDGPIETNLTSAEISGFIRLVVKYDDGW